VNQLSLVHTMREAAPGANAPGERPPLLILLHGVGSNERSMERVVRALDRRFVVVNARSPLAFGADSFGWFHVTFTAAGSVIDAQEAERGWHLLSAFIDEAVVAYGADPERVYVAGFSQGGIMALTALLTAPSKVAGVASMSGRLLPEVLPHVADREALRGKRVLIVHGEQDATLGIHLARWAVSQLESFPLALEYHELQMGHVITQESLEILSRWLSESLDSALSRT